MDGVISGLGERIAEFRKTIGLSQKELAEKTKISRGFISQLETGRANPSINFLNTILRDYKISLNWLISGYGDMFVDKEKTEIQLNIEQTELLKKLLKLPDEKQKHAINSVKEMLNAIELS